jgi:hypothetical protein
VGLRSNDQLTWRVRSTFWACRSSSA